MAVKVNYVFQPLSGAAGCTVPLPERNTAEVLTAEGGQIVAQPVRQRQVGGAHPFLGAGHQLNQRREDDAQTII
jgi:hypothetical protein